jgi:polyisoprenoid-binding protein YceI
VPSEAGTSQRRRRWRWIIGGIAVVVVLAVAGPFIYIHFIEGPAPAKLTLPVTSTSIGTETPTSTGASAVGAGTVDGTWKVGLGSVVGYRVQEVLIGQDSTAVGRTTKVSGTVTIAASTVTGGSFTVDMSSVTSDQSQRNAQFDGRIMDVAQYPTATLRLTAPIALVPVPAIGATSQYSATGDLTMHGVTKAVTFSVSAERATGGIDVLADIPIPFSEWNIGNPSVGGFVTTANTGTLEVLLDLTQGAGNPAVSAGSGSGSGGSTGGAPSQVTVPSTTVPRLTIPTGG